MRSPADDDATVEALFGGWLATRVAGDGADLDALCRAHPAHAASLREMARLHELFLACTPAELRTSGRSLHNRLEQELGAGVDPRVSLEPPPSSVERSDGAPQAPRAPLDARYEVEGEVARGAMGAILRVWDRDLRRRLAMKVALESASAAPGATARDAGRLARFLEEAQVTGQLDHPGIVPVHELGLDERGRVYFTMKLVQGRDLRAIFELVAAGQEGWSETRALGAVLKACEAVAFAHAKGVIHRDLKPANVMVGELGEVYVMDWGLARVLARGEEDRANLPGPGAAGPGGGEGGHPSGSDRAHVTREGDVVGTPAYMPPEQARGEIDRLGPRSDVYSIGAMLYHLLARRPPYAAREGDQAAWDVLAQVREGPPPALALLRRDLPQELVSICEKAMARDPERRYADMRELALDLRAFLEGRVVSAFEAGAWAEARKWVGRNRALAASLAAALALLVAGLTASLFYKARADEQARAASDQAEIAKANAERASQQEAIAITTANDVLSLSAIQELSELFARADELWPARQYRIPELEAWLAEARALVDGRPADASGARARPGLADHRRKLAELEARDDADDPDVRWWRTQLSKLVGDLESFVDPGTGHASAGVVPGGGWGVQKRLDVARTIEEQSLTSPEARARWEQAIASIQDRAACPRYEGLVLAPQLGLLPVGRDPGSGLWEFAHLETGAPVERGSDGLLRSTEESGLVFVLLPGGLVTIGAQKDDPAGPNYDPLAVSNEDPVHEATLAPFFLSKYEMTQGQWVRFLGLNPSQYHQGLEFGGKRITFLHPVEGLSHKRASAVLGALELELPTEAQWEYAMRAGTGTAWPTGADKESLQGTANLADGYAKRNGGPAGRPYEEWLDDGYTVHAPVGHFRANAWGLHDLAGNVYELCRDGLARYDVAPGPIDGLRPEAPANSRVIRGGSFFTSAVGARSARRLDVAPGYSDFNVGVRPARAVVR